MCKSGPTVKPQHTQTVLSFLLRCLQAATEKKKKKEKKKKSFYATGLIQNDIFHNQNTNISKLDTGSDIQSIVVHCSAIYCVIYSELHISFIISHTASYWIVMALAAALLSEDQFTCSICLEIFNNPVSTPCGHSFCQVCISSYWDRGRGGGGGGGEGGGAKIYQCPLCKESFRKRPELQINRSLKEITERFKIIANTEIPINVRGGVEDPNSHPGHHHHPALPLPQRPGEMPECVFAEMMTRFHQLTPGEPNTTLPLPSNPQPQSPNPVDAHLSLQTQNNEYQDPPPPYSPPCRYQTTLIRLH